MAIMRTTPRFCLLDVGNSTTESALVRLPSGQVPKLSDRQRFKTAVVHEKLALLPADIPCIVSSVVPDLNAAISDHFRKTIFVTHQRLTPHMRILLPHPHQVGADRLVTAIAARQIYGKPVLVVDSGTATTFCLVNADGEYEGGNIFPGLGISSKALADYTAKIPLIHVKESTVLCGKSTREAVQTGLYWGFIHMINGMIQQYKLMIPELIVVGTGKGLEVLNAHLALDHYDSDLILKGLAIIAELVS